MLETERIEITQPHQRTRSVTRTLRLDEDLDQLLAKAADKEKVSVNVIANRALRKHVEWDVNADNFGMLTISRRLMKTLISKLSEEEARKLGEAAGREGGREMVTFWFKKFDFENTLKAFDQLAAKYANDFTFNHHFDGEAHTIVMKHDCGIKASYFYGESAKAVFAQLGLRTETFETEDQVMAKVYPVSVRDQG